MIGPGTVVHGGNVTKNKIEIKQGVVIGSSQSAQCQLRYDKGTFHADLFITHFYYEVYVLLFFLWLLLFLLTTRTTTLSSSSSSSIRN